MKGTKDGIVERECASGPPPRRHSGRPPLPRSRLPSVRRAGADSPALPPSPRAREVSSDHALVGIQHVIAEVGAELRQLLLDGVEALTHLALERNARSAAPRAAGSRRCGARPSSSSVPVGPFAQRPQCPRRSGGSVPDGGQKAHDLGLHFVRGLAQRVAVLDPHQVADDSPDVKPKRSPMRSSGSTTADPAGPSIWPRRASSSAVSCASSVTHGWHELLGLDAIESREPPVGEQRVAGNGFGVD